MQTFFFNSCISFVCYSSFGTYLLAQFMDAIIIPVAFYYFQQLGHQAIWWLAAHVMFTSSSIQRLQLNCHCSAQVRGHSYSSHVGEQLVILFPHTSNTKPRCGQCTYSYRQVLSKGAALLQRSTDNVEASILPSNGVVHQTRYLSQVGKTLPHRF